MANTTIDATFPGGNVIVERIQDDEVWFRQDLRDTEGFWFHWLFRIAGAAGRTVKFHFSNKNLLTPAGPSLSDDGVNWRWLGPECVDGDSFTVAFPATPDVFYLTYSIPYVESHLRAFLERHKGRRELRVSTLTTSEKGRAVEKLVLRSPSARKPRKVLLTARHHACESVANYELEGVLDYALDPATGFLRHIELVAIPFIDKDGVEDGDQGKNRRPHDHNRDYTDAPRYASVRALMAELAKWGDERLDVTLDLHCPWIRGGRNDSIFMVLPPESHLPEFMRFARILAETHDSPVRYDPTQDIAFGVEWNNGGGATCCRYMREHTPARIVGSIEFSYGLASGSIVTADGARAFGRCLGKAVQTCIEERL